tara:strand:+ start:5009 stop:6190 length:1182 start_codon:yes stop_codon:yes gene_type:complete
MYKYDYMIVGSGIIGLTIAFELVKRNPNKNIVIIEKEKDIGFHASGRNSGILHAGFYYDKNSLKAKFCIKGNILMKNFCKKNNIHIKNTKKVVVAKDKKELETIFELHKRASLNGVKTEIITSKQLKKINKNICTYEKALFSPNTASVNPIEVLIKLKEILIEKGVHFRFNTAFNDVRKNEYKYLVNCAGLYADKIAKKFNLASNYTMLPFKGIYMKYMGENNNLLNINVYPVPNLSNPFLGVHYTITSDNSIKIGPTATPAFWRENYSALNNFNLFEMMEILKYEIKLFILNSFNFRDLAIKEIRNYFNSNIIKSAQKLVNNFPNNFKPIKAGIRAQLLNTKTNELVQDFIIEHSKKSTHILNTVSPGFTCSFAFSEYVVDEIENNIKGNNL